MDSLVDLDIVGALEGSDKSSSLHFAWDYLRHYEALFAPFRHAPINVLEIGVARGSSLRMWQWFFPNAEITGIDINAECVRHAGPRMHVAIGSQIDAAFLDRVCERAPPTIIIDDGSHVSEHMIFSFEHLLPRLAPGGIYVVEDIVLRGARSPPVRDAAGKPPAPDYFLDLARNCFAREQVPAFAHLPAFVTETVDRVTFIAGAVAMHKFDAARDTARAAATADAYLAGHPGDAEMQARFAEWLLRHDGPLDRAAASVAAAGASGRTNAKTSLLAAAVRLRAGDTEAARAIVAEVARTDPANPHLLLQLAELQARLGDMAGVLATRKAAESLGGMGLPLRRKWASLSER